VDTLSTIEVRFTQCEQSRIRLIQLKVPERKIMRLQFLSIGLRDLLHIQKIKHN
jgi:hypothetical protein